MHTILNRLFLDHMRLEQVLEILNSQIKHFVNDDSEEPDLSLIQDVIEYIRAYPDSFHHPLEEVILDSILEKTDDGEIRKNLRDIKSEHVVLAQLTQRLAADINAVALDQIVSLQEIEEAFNDFYELQLKHLYHENQHFFPLISKLFGEDELEKIVAGIEDVSDPLFDARRAEFEALYQYISES